MLKDTLGVIGKLIDQLVHQMFKAYLTIYMIRLSPERLKDIRAVLLAILYRDVKWRFTLLICYFNDPGITLQNRFTNFSVTIPRSEVEQCVSELVLVFQLGSFVFH